MRVVATLGSVKYTAVGQYHRLATESEEVGLFAMPPLTPFQDVCRVPLCDL